MSEQQPSYEERNELSRENRAEEAAQRLATQQVLDQSEATVENPEFLNQITSLGLTTEKYNWLSEELPALFARPNFLAERGVDYEREVKWLNQNRVERKLAMHQPGRLTMAVSLDIPGAPRHPVLELAQRVHKRPDKDVRYPKHSDDRQALRLMGLAATNYHSNAVKGAGRRAVSEATAVSKVEKQAENESSTRRLAKGVFR